MQVSWESSPGKACERVNYTLLANSLHLTVKYIKYWKSLTRRQDSMVSSEAMKDTSMNELLRFLLWISAVILSIFPFSFSPEDFLYHSHSSMDLILPCETERHCSYCCTNQYFNASLVASSNLNSDLSAC